MDEDRSTSADVLTEEEQERQHLLAVIDKRQAHLKCLDDECARWEVALQRPAGSQRNGDVIAVLRAQIERLKGELAEAEIEQKHRKAALQQQIEEIEQERSRLNAKTGQYR